MSFLVKLWVNPILPQTSKIWVFWGITCEPRIQNGCFLVEITLFYGASSMKKRLQPQILISLEVSGSCMPKIFPNGTRVHGMVSDHNFRTTDPNFMFPSIFHNVLRCLIHLNHQNNGLPLNICRFLGK